MPDDVVKIAIEAVDNASKTINAAGESLENLDKQADKASGGLVDVDDALKNAGRSAEDGAKGFESFAGKIVAIQSGIGIAKEAIEGLKQVWDFAKEGAENQRIAESFNRTAKSIGEDADAIVAKLDEAARGTVDDEELMQASARALTLGVAKSGDDLVNVMKLARAAALQFGGDAGQAFESINQAIGNLTPRALKQYGLIVDLKDANEAYAKSLGVSVSALTEEQQRQALLNEVLKQGQKVFKDVGDSATTTGEKMKALENRVANVIDIFKDIAATGIGTALDITDAPKNAMEAFVGTADKMKQEVIAGRMSVKDYNDGLRGMAQNMSGIVAPAALDLLLKSRQLNESFEASTRGAYGLNGALDESNRAARKTAEATADLNKKQEMLAEVQRMATTGAYGLNGALDESERALRRTKEATADVNEILGNLKAGMSGAIEKEMTQYAGKQDDLTAKARGLREEIEKLTASQGRAVTTTQKQTMTDTERAAATARLAALQEDYATAVKKASETDLEFSARQADTAVKIENVQEGLGKASGAVTSYIDNSKRIKELEGQYNAINKEINANAAAHEEATRRILFGYAEQQLAVGGLTETEAKALDALAVKWDLKSQADITAMQAIRDAAAGLASDGSVEKFVGNVTGALDQANGALNTTQQKLLDVAKAHGALGATKQEPIEIPVKPKFDINAAKQATAQFNQASTIKNAAPTITPKIDTAQAAKDIQSFTTDKVGAIPKEKKTTAVFDSITATSKVNDLTKLFKTLPPVVRTVVDVIGNARVELDQILQGIQSLYDKTIKITVKYTSEGTAPSLPQPTHVPGAASGADFIVPANPRGGTGDYYPVVAAPGERVTVQTKQQQAQPRGGDTYHTTYNVYNQAVWRMLEDQRRRERLARSNARMGV